MQGKVSIVTGVLRMLSTSASLYTNHYDVLGITPKATQGDIKSAFYKLSKLYHPDKSPDEESAKKFRAIAEAYEVLGNIKLKKMYDKGMIVGRESGSHMHYQPEEEPTDPTLKFYKSHGQRHVTPTMMDGRTPVYNFDAWSKNHYGDLLKKKKYDKEMFMKKHQKRSDNDKAANQEMIIYLVTLVGTLFMILVLHGRDDYDTDMTAQCNEHESAAQTGNGE